MVKVDGRKLRAWRGRRLLTLRELGDLTGIWFHTISAIENGRREPRPATVRKLVAALNITPEDILVESELTKAAA